MNKIIDKYKKYYAKYSTKNNKLLSAIIYSYNLLTETEFNALYTIPKRYLLLEEETKEYYLMALINSYLSLKLSIYLPHMLHKKIINKQIALHVLYGEAITQLVILCLNTESSNMLLNNDTLINHGLNKDKKELNKIYSEENKECIILTNKEYDTKTEVKKDFIRTKKEIIKNIFNDILYFNKWTEQNLSLNYLYEITNDFIFLVE